MDLKNIFKGKTFLCFTCFFAFFLLVNFSLSANSSKNQNTGFFPVKTIEAKDVYGDVSKFPLLDTSGLAAGAKAAGNEINGYLYTTVLETLPGHLLNDTSHGLKNPAEIFKNVWPAKDDIGGQSDFSFEVLENTEHIFSLSVTYLFTGAYSEEQTLYFSFDAVSGEHLNIQDVFLPDKVLLLGKKINDERLLRIEDFLQDIKAEKSVSQDHKEQVELFESCKGSMAAADILYGSFYLTGKSVTFIHSRCSPHALMALDELGEFFNEVPLSQFEDFLSTKGRLLFWGKAGFEASKKDSTSFPVKKLLHGSVGGKYQITMVIIDYDADSKWFHGEYFYNRVGGKIVLSGKVYGSQWDFYEEDGEGYQSARIKGNYSQGKFKGIWKSKKTKKELSFEVGF